MAQKRITELHAIMEPHENQGYCTKTYPEQAHVTIKWVFDCPKEANAFIAKAKAAIEVDE